MGLQQWAATAQKTGFHTQQEDMRDVDILCMSIQPNPAQRHGGLVETLEGVRQGLLPARHL